MDKNFIETLTKLVDEFGKYSKYYEEKVGLGGPASGILVGMFTQYEADVLWWQNKLESLKNEK